MDINELKKLVKNSTTVLILDNGDPSFVILNYETYKNLILQEREKEIKISSVHGPLPIRSTANGLETKEPAVAENANETEILEKINKDILALKEEIEKEEKMLAVDPQTP